ncbi:cation transporter (plasmid) [Advenella sp. S44]|uniref:cation diffusion facilitator family transporter n=1 Tax=Advenella sp. S44 TaxID=1982755 RepID=UPI000C2A618D|nr:cation transporter [Advenella sp. S44]PJX19962.1 cation transporter [Advenella sp. S44]
MLSEQDVLRISISVTFSIALLGVVFGLISGSHSIIFEGIYSMIDAVITSVALLVTNLITNSTVLDKPKRKLEERFTMGFWHLEPIVLGLNGVLLLGASVYALINAMGSFLTGGRDLVFTHAIVYTAITALICFCMVLIERHLNKRISSEFLELDAKAWLMSGLISTALLVAFGSGSLIRGTKLQWVSPYIDPAALALVCFIIIPLPLATIKRALADILLITPAALKAHVDSVATETAERYCFTAFRSYVARVGRGTQIELYFVIPRGRPPKRLEEWDELRDEIGQAIGNDTPNRWLTIVFTTDSEWAE